MNVFVTILVVTTCLELCRVSSQSESVISVPCNDQQESCVCDENYNICRFRLEVEELQTFTSYRISKAGQIITRGTPGDTYYLDRDGFKLSLDNDFCARENPPECGQCRRTGGMAIPAAEIETFHNGLNEMNNCSIPMTVDGRTYRLFIAVNGLIPGPTLVATEGQEIIVDVYNRLTSEGITIHWHGIHQRGTPWMDGVASLSHIPIVPGGHFQYRFNATPAGTHWYHSHLGAQRTDGLFGGLIVREHPSRKSDIEAALNSGQITDIPEEHTLTLLDWQRESSLNLFVQIHSTLGFYPNKTLGEVPRDNDLYRRTNSLDGIEVGPVPFFSGLINGRGRYNDTTYSILSVFNIRGPQQKYRFRLIGAQSLYAFRFEIDGHKLNVIATDGHFIRPIMVDYIVIHSGERYDFIPQLMNNVPSAPMNYIIRATTLERNITDRPFHAAEAILHYEGAPTPDMATFYSNVYITDHTTRCISNPCTALNCPFKDYPLSENIRCTNVDTLEALFPPEDNSQLPILSLEATKTLFFNFGFEGQSSTSAINGINFLPPATPYQTYPGQYARDERDDSKNTCKECTPSATVSQENQASKCTCINVKPIFESNQLNDESDKSIMMVFSAVGVNRNRDFAHPVHLHGHSFYVVHIGYGNYSQDGRLLENSPDISCKGDEYCRDPSWQGNMPSEILGSGRVNESAIQKDTVLLPAGGYVVVAFQANNPGYWFLHCHIEVHQLEGMAVIIKEYNETEHPSPPTGINTVGDYTPVPATTESATTVPAITKSDDNPGNVWMNVGIAFIVITAIILIIILLITIACIIMRCF